MSYTLKLKGDMSLPGLALPEAFNTLDSRLESVMQLSTAKGSPEAQVVGLITVCEELKQLLKCAFIENGMLASRIEILTRYQMESMKKMEKKVSAADVESTVTRKHMKRLRKRLNAQLVMQKKKNGNWWDMSVRTSDYDSFVTLSRAGDYPDLEFMLRVNQLMIDFVSDTARTELVLPPMGLEERQEVSKLASIYKLRCRYGKSVQLAPSTLLKARQACVPAAGEVDAILNSFARSHVQRKVTEEVVTEPGIKTGTNAGKELASSGPSTSNKEEHKKPKSITLPSTMLTPIPSLPSPTIDISSLKHSSHSPPGSAQATPTGADSSASSSRWLKQLQQKEGGASGVSGASLSTSSLVDRKSSVATQSGNLTSSSPAAATPRPHPLTTPHYHRVSDIKKSVIGAGSVIGAAGAVGAVGKVKESGPSVSPVPTLGELRPPPPSSPRSTTSTSNPSAVSSPALTGTVRKPPIVQQLQPTSTPPSSLHPVSPVGIILTPSSSSSPLGTRPPTGGVLVQSPLRGLPPHSTVLALPIKCQPPPSPTSQVGTDVLSGIQPLRSLRKEGNGKKRGIEGEVGATGEEGTGGEVGSGGGSARTDVMGPPVKRVRVTRRSAAEEEQAKL